MYYPNSTNFLILTHNHDIDFLHVELTAEKAQKNSEPRSFLRNRVRLSVNNGGEAGIWTLGAGIHPHNGLANRRLKPLGHLSDKLQLNCKIIILIKDLFC